MLRFFKRIFKRKEPKLQPMLRIWDQNGEEVLIKPIGVFGLHLVCEDRQHFISEAAACDRTQFWLHWKRLGGIDLGLRWEEDDQPFDPLG